MVKHNIWVSFVVYKEGDLVNRETIYTYLCRPSPQLYISPDTKSGTGLSVKTQLNQIQKITEYLYQTWFSGLVSNFPPFLLLPSYLILNILPVWAAQSTRQTAAGTIFKLNFSRISASQVCDTWRGRDRWWSRVHHGRQGQPGPSHQQHGDGVPEGGFRPLWQRQGRRDQHWGAREGQWRK